MRLFSLLKWSAVPLCLAGILFFVKSAGADALQLSVTAGPAPLEVRVIGPLKLISNNKGTPQPFVSCGGYTIDWGDGHYSPMMDTTCAAGFVHTYAKPGEYTVRASLWHSLPTDGQQIDWSGVASITVK